MIFGTYSTSCQRCPNCGYSTGNCGGSHSYSVTVSSLRNWREEDEEFVDHSHRPLIRANWFSPAELLSVLSPLVRLWPQARAPPVSLPSLKHGD